MKEWHPTDTNGRKPAESIDTDGAGSKTEMNRINGFGINRLTKGRFRSVCAPAADQSGGSAIRDATL